MIISYEKIIEILSEKNIFITGVFHVGAHDCEEMDFYNFLNLSKNDVVWVEALDFKVAQARSKGIPNVYNAVITDKDDEDIVFNITNNIQSSSVLELALHSVNYPSIVYTDHKNLKTVTVDSFFIRNNLNASKYNFWNFDIQGAELLALKGAINSLKDVKVLYLEVNVQELYKDCALIDHIDDFLLSHNFKRVLTVMTDCGWGDALYIIDE